ncbi:MAG TPA: hypothetical protein VHB97_15105 [Polyangia bacterium]|jgi:hypothetical protein|nr:hypothetical protein [Polyangia bacterium]
MAALGAGGCFGSNAPNGNDDAAYGTAPDLGPLCIGNNDGKIDRNELSFPLGASVDYLANPSGTTTTVAPDGTQMAGVTEWDLTSTAGDVHKLTLEPLAGKWFASSFSGATYATTTDLATNTLGIFRVADDGLYILGYASESPNQTLLVYDAPILSLKFPVTLGDAWVSTAHIVNGMLNGQPYAGLDTYKISIDARGTAVLPFLSFDNTMRVHVDLTQTVPGGISVSRIQYLFFHECYGELGRMVSVINESNEMFTNAGEFRRLAL